MNPLIELAWKEFTLPFSYFQKGGCPGRRDFLWMTVFMTLILTLTLLLAASREGLLNRFVDVFLGNVPDYGVRVSVKNNMLSKGGLNGIDTSVLTEIEKSGYKVFPYRHLESSLNPLVALPDSKIWRNRRNGDKIGPDFDGWAVYSDDPMWNFPSPHSGGLSLEIVMARNLFLKYFDYQQYYSVLKKKLPEDYFANLPQKIDKSSVEPMKALWIKIRVGSREELHSCKIHWVEQFTVIDRIAFVFPLSTYHALYASHDFPELRFFPESYNQGDRRLKIIRIEAAEEYHDDSKNELDRYNNLFSPIDGAARLSRGDIEVTFRKPVRSAWVEAFTRQYKLEYDILDSVKAHIITHTENNELILPCSPLPEQDLKFSSCKNAEMKTVHLDMTTVYGFNNALIYLPDRTLISTDIEKLLGLKDHALSLHPSYQDALKRFSFLSKMLSALQQPYMVFLILFLFFLILAQMGTLLGNKRHNYGIYLAKGLGVKDVYFIITLQIFWAAALGMIVAISSITGASMYLRNKIIPIAKEFNDTLNIADFNLLPITMMDYVYAFIFVLAVGLGLAYILLFFMPVRKKAPPALLLH